MFTSPNHMHFEIHTELDSLCNKSILYHYRKKKKKKKGQCHTEIDFK